MEKQINNNMSATEKITVSAQELLSLKIEKQPCLVEPIFPKVGLAAVAGSSDTGKSTLMRQLCINVAAGSDDFLGYKINATHKKALYVSTEDGKTQIAPLLTIQNKGFKFEESSLSGFRYIFNTSNLLDNLSTVLKESPHDLIVVDAFADLYGNDLNQANQVRSYLDKFNQLAEEHECLFIFVHHTGKGSENKRPDKNNLLGSQGFEAKLRTVVILLKDKVKPNVRHFCLVKGNYLPEALKKEATELLFNETMIFTPTGNTELLENLSKDSERKYKTEEVIRLNKQGLTQNDIHKQTGISQSTISRILAAENVK